MNQIKINCIHCWQSISFEVNIPDWETVRCTYCNADLGTINEANAAASMLKRALAR